MQITVSLIVDIAASADVNKIEGAVEALLTYLENQQAWIGNDDQWQRQGYPIGSGIFEREVALVIYRRMKRQGMRRIRDNADGRRFASANTQCSLG